MHVIMSSYLPQYHNKHLIIKLAFSRIDANTLNCLTELFNCFLFASTYWQPYIVTNFAIALIYKENQHHF